MKTPKILLFVSIMTIVSLALYFYLPNLKATSETPANTNTFSFEKFSNLTELQAELDRRFKLGTPIEEIDVVLFDKVGAIRSDNLIGNDKTKSYRKGTSSADNYVFYYKPLTPAGKNGWEETSSGWVVKAVHGNIPLEGDDKFQLSMGGSGKGLKEIVALTVPSSATETTPNENITLIKELLQYKMDTTPIERFDETEWSELVTKHQSSPCMADLSYSCLMQQTLELLDIPNDPERRSYLRFLADMTIEHGDVETTKVLIKSWPTAEEIRTYEESLPRLRRQTDAAIDGTIRWFHIQYMQLLFLAGDYEQAEKLLVALHNEQKAGTDYGAISVLVNKGDLERAYKIAELTLEWKRETPDPKRNSSAHMHCNIYQNPQTRPAAMGDLALAYIEKSELDKGYQVAQMVKRYWENKAYGQSSYCYTNFAQSSYFSAMEALFKAYSQNGDKEKANSVFHELQTTQTEQTESVKRYTKDAFERLARIAAEQGVTESLDEIAEFVEKNNKMDYPSVYNRNTNDPVVMIYALAGEYEKAIDHVEKHDYSKDKPAPTPLDEILGPDKDTPDAEIRLTTYLKTAKALSDVGDKEGAMLFLDKATPYFGSRNPKYDAAVDNLSDYITKANILLDLGEKEKSREVLSELIDLYNKTTSEDYRDGQITAGFYGSFAYLYARHENIQTVQEWADSLPSFYSGHYYSLIAKLLIDEKRWDELDIYMKEMAKAFATDESPTVNWRHFARALIDAGEYDRYMHFLDMLDDVPDEVKERQPKRAGTYITRKTAKTPDTKKQIWIMTQLIASKLSGQNVSQEIIEQIWPRYITNCQSWSHALPRYGQERNKLPDAKETMAACYVGMIKSLEELQRFPS